MMPKTDTLVLALALRIRIDSLLELAREYPGNEAVLGALKLLCAEEARMLYANSR